MSDEMHLQRFARRMRRITSKSMPYDLREVVVHRDAGGNICHALVAAGVWFCVTPMPEDEVCIAVRDEHGSTSQLEVAASAAAMMGREVRS